jgi:hypothetical protein
MQHMVQDQRLYRLKPSHLHSIVQQPVLPHAHSISTKLS